MVLVLVLRLILGVSHISRRLDADAVYFESDERSPVRRPSQSTRGARSQELRRRPAPRQTTATDLQRLGYRSQGGTWVKSPEISARDRLVKQFEARAPPPAPRPATPLALPCALPPRATAPSSPCGRGGDAWHARRALRDRRGSRQVAPVEAVLQKTAGALLGSFVLSLAVTNAVHPRPPRRPGAPLALTAPADGGTPGRRWCLTRRARRTTRGLRRASRGAPRVPPTSAPRCRGSAARAAPTART